MRYTPDDEFRFMSEPWKAQSGAGYWDAATERIRGPFVSALFASMFDDHTIEWLNKRGYQRWDERCQGEAIIAAVNAVIARHR